MKIFEGKVDVVTYIFVRQVDVDAFLEEHPATVFTQRDASADEKGLFFMLAYSATPDQMRNYLKTKKPRPLFSSGNPHLSDELMEWRRGIKHDERKS